MSEGLSSGQSLPNTEKVFSELRMEDGLALPIQARVPSSWPRRSAVSQILIWLESMPFIRRFGIPGRPEEVGRFHQAGELFCRNESHASGFAPFDDYYFAVFRRPGCRDLRGFDGPANRWFGSGFLNLSLCCTVVLYIYDPDLSNTIS